jgi:diguanylate cyclase (GGDEF)-like protein
MSPDLTKPDCAVLDLLKSRVANGTFSGNPEKYVGGLLATIAQGETAKQEVETGDGRIISVVNQPMVDGGWIATHEDITERRRTEAIIARMAHYDALTGLPNRALFLEELDRALALVQRGGRFALLYLDLDQFKRVNDTLGHIIGDELLKIVADRLRGCVRETDLIARLGGDEFAIIQTSLEPSSDPAALAERISEALKAPSDIDRHKVVAGVSIGIAIAPNDAADRDQLVKCADMALYGAKGGGRGTYCFYEPELDARVKARHKLDTDLCDALANGEFELYYQPIVNLQTNQVSGCEALLRWHHPERGMVEPTEFIPVAEENGLIASLGEWVLRQACADAATWPDGVKVAVNLSPTQLMGGKLLPVVINALAASGMSASRLELEITESVLMQNTFASLAMLHQLRDIGVRIAMDDFGTGYSSLSYLRSFPFDKIKIDRSFIEGISEENDCAAIVEAVIDMAHRLNMTTTAEGIETVEQREKVRELGCTELQGYLFSRPKPLAEILPLLAPRAEMVECEASAA